MSSNLKQLIVVLVLFGIVLLFNWRVRDKVFQIRYDLMNKNEVVVSKSQIETILAGIEKISYDQLDEEYLSYTKSDEDKYKKLVKDLPYYKIKRNDLNKKIVGHFRIKDFICTDDYFVDCTMNRIPELICTFNEKIFFKTLELQEELENAGYDKEGFWIVNGHRHPSYNEEIKGASLSRHIKGEAVDISVDDVNGDGYADKADKDIILDLLENKIIGDEGGIGLYPGTGAVHYDVRGYRARWNDY